MTDAAYRRCPLCGTRNRHYMLVCTHCARSLRRVPLVGSAAADSIKDALPNRAALARGLVLLVLVAAVPLVLVRALRTARVEPSAVAASPEGDVAWETLEERWAAVVPPPTPLPTAPPSTPFPVPPATLAPRFSEPPTAAIDAPPAPASAVEPDPERAARRALRRAERRLRDLEERAALLRALSHEVAGDPVASEDVRRELAQVSAELDEAAREVVRAAWALRAVQ